MVSFVPLSELFSLQTDLGKDGQRFGKRFDATALTSMRLQQGASEIGLGASGTDAGAGGLQPLPLEMVGAYICDTMHTQWQYRPGTRWEMFPPWLECKLNAAFENLAMLDDHPAFKMYATCMLQYFGVHSLAFCSIDKR